MARNVGEELGSALHRILDVVDSVLEKDPKSARERIIEARDLTDAAAMALDEVTTLPAAPPAPDFGPCLEIVGARRADGTFPTCGAPSVYDGKRCEEHRNK